MSVVVDVKRTGVRARMISGVPDFANLEPGQCCQVRTAPDYLHFACPGCGRLGRIRVGKSGFAEGPRWDVVRGSTEFPENLTLAQLIRCTGCCGWRGYLKNGVFEACIEA